MREQFLLERLSDDPSYHMQRGRWKLLHVQRSGRKASELPKIQLSVPAAAAFAAAESAASTAGVAIWILKGRERREKESRTHRRVFLR